MASLLHSFEPPGNGLAQRAVVPLSNSSISDNDINLSPNVTRQESAVLLGSKEVNGEDNSKRPVLCVRKTRSGGHKTYCTENDFQMVRSFFHYQCIIVISIHQLKNYLHSVFK